MKISYNWLKEMIPGLPDPEEVSIMLTDCGLEVESLEAYESIKGGLKGIVTGEVKTCQRHPDADRLSLTTVDVGAAELLNIVCGAPNVAQGQKVLVATIGAVIYSDKGDFEIKKSKIRGQLSEGMICAEDELGLGHSHEGILVLDPSVPVGRPAAEIFKVYNDFVFEIGLTPNRADAASHLGVARDIAALLSLKKKTKVTKPVMASVANFKSDKNSLHIPVEVQNHQACPRYCGLTISGVKVAESPEWLKNKLMVIGLRPINNIVDITNYVLHETGQPLHAFDVAHVKGNKVVVRNVKKGTKFLTLDEVERELQEEDLMICNESEPMCIAGVFGGLHSGVSETTTQVFLESAYFSAVSVRKTSRNHALKTDSSFRFERGTDPEMPPYALKRAAMLIKEIAGGEITSQVVDVYPHPVKEKIFTVEVKSICALIGKDIEPEIIKSILEALDIKIMRETQGGWEIHVPAYRVDVTREADITEEVLRIYGYNNIEMPPVMKMSSNIHPFPDKEDVQNQIGDMLAAKGFIEIMSNSLSSGTYTQWKEQAWDAAENVNILNPLSKELNVMRQTLLFGGLEAIAYNQNRKVADMKLFEFGNVYSIPKEKAQKDQLEKYYEFMQLGIFLTGQKKPETWSQKSEDVNFFDLKAAVYAVLKRLGFTINDIKTADGIPHHFAYGLEWKYNNKWLCNFGEISTELLEKFDIKQAVYYAELNWSLLMEEVKHATIRYKEVPKFPEVRRDLALLIDHTVSFEQIEQIAFRIEKRLLKQVNLFDIYKGEKIGKEKKSYAVSYFFQDDQKTLTDQEIEKIMSKLVKAYSEELNASIR